MEMKAHQWAEEAVGDTVVLMEVMVRKAVAAGAVAVVVLEGVAVEDTTVGLTEVAEEDREGGEAWGKCLKITQGSCYQAQ